MRSPGSRRDRHTARSFLLAVYPWRKGQEMRELLIICVVAGLSLMTATSARADIMVTGIASPQDLVNEILGSGVTVSNVVYTGYLGASGLFTDGLSSGLQVDSGIVLTSGYASNITGLNTSDAITGDLGLPGDADLQAQVPGYWTYDATVLEFDFESAGGDVYFNYLFGSDEYNEWTNTSFNDVFGFFLDGSNIALIPGTTTPVSVNNVNGGNPLGVDASHPEFYNNNDLSDGGPFFPFEYDGFTDGFTATALDLAPGTHHIKLAISDSGDPILDSGVFIQTGTFSDDPTPVVPVPGAVLLGMLGLGAAGLRLRKSA